MVSILDALGVVMAALITGVFGIFAARFRKENTAQHVANQVHLTHIGREIGEIKDDVSEVRGSQQRHLEWHAETK
jgi:hypothetical protein